MSYASFQMSSEQVLIVLEYSDPSEFLEESQTSGLWPSGQGPSCLPPLPLSVDSLAAAAAAAADAIANCCYCHRATDTFLFQGGGGVQEKLPALPLFFFFEVSWLHS